MVKSARTGNAGLNQLRQQQQAAERRRRVMIAGSAVIAILVVVGALIVTSVLAPKQGAVAAGPLDPGVASALGNVPASAFDTVAVGVGATNPPTAITAPALTADGKPRVLYVGAEYCPFCAGERWPVVVALSRFGQFSNLKAAMSAPAPETNPNTPTVSFHGSSYTSHYLSFTGVETQTNTHEELEALSPEDQSLFDTYNPGGSIPWITFGGQLVQSGASVDPGIFAGKSQDEIAKAVADPATEISKAVLGSANVLTARLCQLTQDQPEAVCSTSGVAAAAATLP